jgi:RNA polymerase sigma-70 factor (ECF subfamily)
MSDGMPDSTRESEQERVRKLRSGDEAAFVDLVNALHGRLLALARTFTRSPALAEDIVQETWLAVIRGLAGFEGRSSLRTWIYSILVKRARSIAGREARKAPPQGGDSSRADGPEWEPGAGKLGLWTERPVPWGFSDPAALFQSKEALRVVEQAMNEMPEMQRRVLLLRDVDDVAAAEVRNTLEISETNLRVLLHRGRARVRRALDRYLRDSGALPPRPDARQGRAKAPGPPEPRAGSIGSGGGDHGL